MSFVFLNLSYSLFVLFESFDLECALILHITEMINNLLVYIHTGCDLSASDSTSCHYYIQDK